MCRQLCHWWRLACLVLSSERPGSRTPPAHTHTPPGAEARARPRSFSFLAFTTHIGITDTPHTYNVHDTARGGRCPPRKLSRAPRPAARLAATRHRRRRVGVHAPRHEWQHRQRTLGVVGLFGGAGGRGVIAGGSSSGSGSGNAGTGCGGYTCGTMSFIMKRYLIVKSSLLIMSPF